MNERERVPVYVEVEVCTRQQRERREQAQAQPRQIEPDSVIDWRSYGRRSVPRRWLA